MGKPSYTAIIVERRAEADWITLNRPEWLNALDRAMVDDLLEYFGVTAEDPASRVIVRGRCTKRSERAEDLDGQPLWSGGGDRTASASRISPSRSISLPRRTRTR